jgi:hypothetical protein
MFLRGRASASHSARESMGLIQAILVTCRVSISENSHVFENMRFAELTPSMMNN